MKPRTRNRVAAILLISGVSAPAHASPICLAPEPACAVMLLGAAVTTIIQHERDENETDEQQVRRKNMPNKVGARQVTHADRHPGVIPIGNQGDERWVLREAGH